MRTSSGLRVELLLAAAIPVVLATPAGAKQDRPAAPTIGTEVGQMYPDFLLPSLDDGLGRLSDYRGKKVLLIHFASW